MPKDNKFNGAEIPMDHASNGPNGAIDLQPFDEERPRGFLHSYLGLLAVRHRRLLLRASLASMAAVFVLTYFVMHWKYEATAVIRPLGQNSNSIGQLLQSTGLSNSIDYSGTGIDSDIGTNVHDPDELVTILNSYTFTTNMIEAEQLGPRLTKGAHSIWALIPFTHRGTPSLWSYYLAMSSRFNCDFSMRTGNITVTFDDKDPEFAKHVLTLYIDRLRNQLRAHDVRYSKAAGDSLVQEAAGASDPMMRDDLYDLAARQIKKASTAEANSDFAFAVLEEPFVPPYRAKPWVLLDTLLAGIVVPMLIFLFLVVRDWGPRARKELAEAASESERFPDSIALSRKIPRHPVPEDDKPYPPDA
jgi:hypothetical protein